MTPKAFANLLQRMHWAVIGRAAETVMGAEVNAERLRWRVVSPENVFAFTRTIDSLLSDAS